MNVTPPTSTSPHHAPQIHISRRGSINITMPTNVAPDREGVLEGWKIGGETSGHILCLDKTSTGDGIIAALQVLAIMIKQQKTLKELTSGLHLLPQSLLSLKTDIAANLASHPQVLDAVKDLDSTLKNTGRVLLRPSGTEPILRVMVEGQDPTQVKVYAQDLLEAIRKIAQQEQ